MADTLIDNIMAIEQNDLGCREKLGPSAYVYVNNSQATEVVAIGEISQGNTIP